MTLFHRDAFIMVFVDETHVPKEHAWKRVYSRFGGRKCTDCRLYVTERMMRNFRLPPCVASGMRDRGFATGS